ncbi:hypothetical protein JDV02_009999 [Purpureocillium takamizusanense]|uniref:RRM domain-containing protein n=1 Tax=Purpureocillium takamizusanense TaxID=2060973 RepID=A0A9Q8QR99_9HYPO|nr:uncharacterized protein JDV02_009999 [Purpureocillium takamizusanense]UNI24233.1 hypothetical protein JDV02_009999 [Purpureocillium takamizusanense]
MAEADFEIDFYGDAGNEQQSHQEGSHAESRSEYRNENDDHGKVDHGDQAQHDDRGDHDQHNREEHGGEHRRQTSETEDTPSRQGVKRKSEEDDRPVDPNATAAVMISELSWWTTDDDIRGWLRGADCETEVKELTFSEHKVNGKSKGQAYIEFYSRQAATAAKHHIDHAASESAQPGQQKKLTTSYCHPGMNPFRTLPKDAPARVKEQPRAAPSGPYNDRGNYGGGGFRGRGGYGGGRGMNQNNFNSNRNFNNNMGFNNNNMGGGFNGPMGGGNFGFQGGRGGMMGGGMRGGPGGMRGGRGNNMMGMGGPMGGMPMGMPGNMGMMGMGGGMPGFQGMNPNFNGGFGFNQSQGGGGDWGNPHGAKRPRPE